MANKKPKTSISNIHEIGLLVALIIVMLTFGFTTDNFFT